MKAAIYIKFPKDVVCSEEYGVFDLVAFGYMYRSLCDCDPTSEWLLSLHSLLYCILHRVSRRRRLRYRRRLRRSCILIIVGTRFVSTTPNVNTPSLRIIIDCFFCCSSGLSSRGSVVSKSAIFSVFQIDSSELSSFHWTEAYSEICVSQGLVCWILNKIYQTKDQN